MREQATTYTWPSGYALRVLGSAGASPHLEGVSLPEHRVVPSSRVTNSDAALHNFEDDTYNIFNAIVGYIWRQIEQGMATFQSTPP
jgi:hypothetical protein